MSDNLKFNKFGVMLDCSRNAVLKPETVKKFIDIISKLGYNCLMLYTEDTYEIKEHPYFGHNRGRYSAEEIRDIDAYSKSKGIELIPCIQTLAHLNAIFRWPVYNEICDCDDILLCDNEKTYNLIDSMFKTLKENFTSNTVNIGMDEAHMIGRGKHTDIYGYESRVDVLLKHLCRVSEIAKKYDFNLIMWGDMFFRIMRESKQNGTELLCKIKKQIPDNVNLIYWDYYSHDKAYYNRDITSYSSIKEGIWFAGGLWRWSGFAPHNNFSILANEASFSVCCDHGVKDVFLTCWGDNGGECSVFSLLPSLYHASQLAKGNTDISKIKCGFEEEFGISFDDFMLLELPQTPNDSKKIINSDKYLLYNDCFMGIFDSVVTDNDAIAFKNAAQRLKNVPSNYEYYYLFKTLEKLCEVLSLKCNLGNKTRNAYKSGNKEEIKLLISEYDILISLITDFYNAFEKQWMAENKPHGFDVQDIRIGGLIKRIEHCKLRLLEYANGEISRIEELEEPLLDVNCRDNDSNHLEYNSWDKTVTSNCI